MNSIVGPSIVQATIEQGSASGMGGGLAKPRFEDLIQHLWQRDGQQGLLPRRVARDAAGHAQLRAQEDDTQVQ
jgi:hypothetical protein